MAQPQNNRGVPESTILFRSFRRTYRGRRQAVEPELVSKPYQGGRDPAPIGATVTNLTSRMGWDHQLAQALVANQWADIVGPSVAEHSWPVFDGTRLTIRCASTAWASALKMMRSAIEGTLRDNYPELDITELHFRGPDAPSWKKGPRTVTGRGPRDTYG